MASSKRLGKTTALDLGRSHQHLHRKVYSTSGGMVAAWPFSADAARAMYVGNRANATARRLARFWARAIVLGLLPKRWVTLEVVGRRSGRPLPAGDGRLGRPVVPRVDARRAVQLGPERAGHGWAGNASTSTPDRMSTGRSAGQRAPPDHQALPPEGAGRPPAHPGRPARGRRGVPGHRVAVPRLPGRTAPPMS